MVKLRQPVAVLSYIRILLCFQYKIALRIGQRSYWVNVKNHKHFGEVIYAIESERPKDLIKGHKKSDIENVYSFLQGTGAIDINITMQK